MKKLITMVCVLLYTTQQMNAQAYLSVGIGQNLCFNSNDPYGLYGDNKNAITTLKSFNLGRGFEPRFSFGYMFSKYLGAELGLGYLLGQKNERTFVNGSETEVNTMYSRLLRIAPAIVISAGYGKLNPYGKFGLNIGMGKIVTDYSSVNGTNKEEATWVDKGVKGMGMFGGFGVEYFITKKATLYLEAQATNLSVSPTKGELTKLEYNGSDELSDLNTIDKETEYVKELNSMENIPDSSPDKELKPTFSFGTNNFTLGFRFRF